MFWLVPGFICLQEAPHNLRFPCTYAVSNRRQGAQGTQEEGAPRDLPCQPEEGNKLAQTISSKFGYNTSLTATILPAILPSFPHLQSGGKK
jgi:hypothetical protein